MKCNSNVNNKTITNIERFNVLELMSVNESDI